MGEDLAPQATTERKGSRGFYTALAFLGALLLLIGLMSTAGSLMSDRLSGNSLGNPFDFIFTPVILYLVPAILIAYSLANLETKFRVTVAGVVAIFLFGVLVTMLGSITKTYNYFVQADESATQSFNNVEIIYQKRFNLIRNLDTASRSYQEHERGVLKDIADARRDFGAASTDNEKISAIGKFDETVRNLIVNIERYPNLKADQVILELMKAISATERELGAQKAEFNKRVTDYNKSIRLMPYALTARIFNFQPRKFIDRENSSEIYDAGKLLTPRK